MILLLTSLLSAAFGAGDAARVEQAAWLQGCWQLSANGLVVEEQWMAPGGGVMLGMGRTVRDGKLVEYESVILREEDGKPCAGSSKQPT
jgi:uncharacterized protein DUF6265